MTPSPGDPRPQGLAESIRRLFARETDEVSTPTEPSPGPQAAEEATHPVDSSGGDGAGELAGMAAGATESLAQGDLEAVADAAVALAREFGEDREALERARTLASPVVATLLVARVRRVAGHPRRLAELREALPLLGTEVEFALLEALRREARDPEADRGGRRAYLSVVEAFARQGSDILRQMAEDRDWRLVRNAAWLLGELGNDEALPLLAECAAHGDSRVRREAVQALVKMGGPTAGNVVMARLEDPDSGVRAQAARSLTTMDADGALPALLGLLERERDNSVNVEVVRALGLIGDPGVTAELERRAVPSLLRRPPREVRLAAYRALWAVGTPSARALVRQALEDRDSHVRRLARSLLDQAPS